MAGTETRAETEERAAKITDRDPVKQPNWRGIGMSATSEPRRPRPGLEIMQDLTAAIAGLSASLPRDWLRQGFNARTAVVALYCIRAEVVAIIAT